MHPSVAPESQTTLGHRRSFGVESSHRMSTGSISSLTAPGTGQIQASKPRHCFVLEASPSAEKGRGVHMFELEGGSLAELTTSLERFMERRFNPDSTIFRDSDAQWTTSLPTSNENSLKTVTQDASLSCDRPQQPQVSSSPEGCGSLHSVSPAQGFTTQPHSRPTFHTNPLSTPNTHSIRSKSPWTGLDTNIHGRPTQTLPSPRFTNPSTIYSNFTPPKPLLSPPDHIPATGKLEEADMFNCSQTSFLRPQLSSGTNMESGLPSDNFVSSSELSHNYNIASGDPTTSSLTGAATLPPSWSTRSSSKLLRKSVNSGARPSLPCFSESADEAQVARVPAGLVIPKILASPSTPNSVRMKRPVLSAQPPTLSSKVLLQRGSCPTRSISITQSEPFSVSDAAPSICSVASELDSQSVPTTCRFADDSMTHEDRQCTSDDRLKQHGDFTMHDGETHPTSYFLQQGVFTADEDLWDAGHGDPVSTDLVDTLNRHPVCPQPASNLQAPASSSKLTFSKNSVGGCPLCKKKNALDNVGYQLYRTRCQQYKTCWCHTYVGRSLSADTLMLLDFFVSDKLDHLMVAVPDPHSNEKSERPSVETRTSFDQVGPQPKYSSGSASRHLPKSCGLRWKQIHRFFNRKQSYSQENIGHECHCPVNTDLSRKTLPYSSLVEPELTSDACSSDVDSKTNRASALHDQNANTFALKQPHLLSIRCPRHGFLLYSPLVQYLLNSPTHFPLCSRCRKRKHRERGTETSDCPKTTRNDNSSLGLVDRFHGVTLPSVTSAFRMFVHMRQKSQATKFSLRGSALSKKSTAVDKDSYTRGVSTPSVPEEACRADQSHAETNLPSNAVQSQIARTPGLCDYHSQHLRRVNSHLSLTSLPCSEPAIPRFHARLDRAFELETRSPFSSLSSLLTFRSLSGSSSLISACHGFGHVKKAVAGSLSPQNLEGSSRDTRDASEEKVPCSLCDGDDLSSGSVSACYDDLYSMYERRLSEHHRTAIMAKNLDIPQSPSHNRQRRPGFRNQRTEDSALSGLENDAINRPWSHLKFAPNVLSLDQENHSSNYCLCFAPASRSAQSTKRANTLPNAKFSLTDSNRKSSDSSASMTDSASTAKLRFVKDSKTSSWNLQTNIGLDRLLPRFTRRGRCQARYNTANVITTPLGSERVARKLSSQSDLGVACNSFGDVDTTDQSAPPNLEPQTYCNVTPVPHNATKIRPECLTQNSTKVQKPHSHQKKPDASSIPANSNSKRNTHRNANSNLYVNLSINTVDPTMFRSGRSAQQTLQSMHPPAYMNVKKSSHSLNVNDTILHSSSLPNKSISTDPSLGRPSCSHTSHAQTSSHGQGRFQPGDQGLSMHFSGGMESSDLPAEVRDPSRNYAMVDLRPSPASSTHVHTELTVNAIQQAKSPTLRFGEVTSTASSTASTIGFSNSTSTGSDCTSDATIVYDTAEKGALIPDATDDDSSTRNTSSLFAPSLAVSKEPSRRRHSHSLSSVASEAPVLNYVDVITSTAPFVNQESNRRIDPSALSDPSGSSIPEHTHSFSSSSGLGGIASQSITPPLAPGGSASFGDIFISRSMTSSATSSGEGITADQGFHSCSPPDSNCVAYTQIDIIRTMALEELSSDIAQEKLSTGAVKSSTSGSQSHPWCPPKIDRSTSVRKTLSRPIRSMRRGTQKKTGGFFS